jgi:hypothetical protein
MACSKAHAGLLLLLCCIIATMPTATSANVVCHAVSPGVTDQWCDNNCNASPPNCPPTLCACDGAPTPAPPPATPTPPPPAPTPAGPGRRVTCYVPAYDSSWGAPVLEHIPAHCTHLNLAFAVANAQTGRFDAADVGTPSEPLKQQIAAAQARGVLVTVAIGGWTGRAAWPMIGNRTAFAMDAVAYLRSWATGGSAGLDGIDLDVEHAPMSAVTDVVAELVTALRPHVKVLSWAGWMGGAVPVAAGGDRDQDSTAIFAKVGSLIDHVNVMSYIFDPATDSVPASCDVWAVLLGDPAKVSVGICNDHPDCNAANGGFATPELATNLTRTAVKHRFGGVMFWDDNLQDAAAPNDGLSVLQEGVRAVCGVPGFACAIENPDLQN